MDMSPPIFLWLSSGLRRLAWALVDVDEIDILHGDVFDESIVVEPKEMLIYGAI
jgi:hypothetical protein